MNTVLTYIFGNAELLRDPTVVTPNTNYYVITDNKALKSHIWEPIIVPRIPNIDVRAQVAAVKFNPFIIKSDKYLIIDASHQITSDLTSLFSAINKSTICAKRHPKKVDIITEIGRWKRARDLTVQHEANFMNYLKTNGYNNTKALSYPVYEGCFIGITNNTLHRNIFGSIISLLYKLRDVNIWFPSNQIIYSYLINTLQSKNFLTINTINTDWYSIRFKHNTWHRVKD